MRLIPRIAASLSRVRGRCPICRTPTLPEDPPCPRCQIPHHMECWEYAGDCGIFGCRATPIVTSPGGELPVPRSWGGPPLSTLLALDVVAGIPLLIVALVVVTGGTIGPVPLSALGYLALVELILSTGILAVLALFTALAPRAPAEVVMGLNAVLLIAGNAGFAWFLLLLASMSC